MVLIRRDRRCLDALAFNVVLAIGLNARAVRIEC
jgi:hypothetical protein